MLAGGQIAGVSGMLPHCFESKPSRSHVSGVTPEHDQAWLTHMAMKRSLPLILWQRLVSPLSACPSLRLCSNSFTKDNGGLYLDIVCVFVHSWLHQPHNSFHVHVLPEAMLKLRYPARRHTSALREFTVHVNLNMISTCSFALVPGSAAWVSPPFAALGSYGCRLNIQ